MKKRNREINVFSMSALDLFASALGAFILLGVLLLPYFPNTSVKEKEFAIMGITTEAKSFVLVVDFSGSMEKYKKQLKYTVGLILEPLTPKNKFAMITYQGGGSTSVQIKEVPPTTRRTVIVADNSNKTTMLRNLSGRLSLVGGGTPTLVALKESLQYNAEAIIILSDGSPSDGSPDDIVREITGINGGRKKIYAIAVGDYSGKREFVGFLQNLAASNGGAFLGAPNPP